MTNAVTQEVFLNGVPPNIYKAFISPYLKAKRINCVTIFGKESTCPIRMFLEEDGISYTYYDQYLAFRGLRNNFFLLLSFLRSFPMLLVALASPVLFWRFLSKFNQQLLFAINDELRKAESRRNYSFNFISFRFHSFLLYLRFVTIYASLKLYMDASPRLVLISGHRVYLYILPILAFGFRSSIFFVFGMPLFQSSPYSKNFKCFPHLLC